MKRTYLVTGGKGFIGTNLISYLMSDPTAGEIIVVDNNTIGSNPIERAGVQYHHLDICDRTGMQKIFKDNHIDVVLHLAAESHVDRSIKSAYPFIQTNIIGTHTILELVKEFGCKLVHVSTDEVYGDIHLDDIDLDTYECKCAFKEDSLIKPNSPYAASKASSDLLVRSYINSAL